MTNTNGLSNEFLIHVWKARQLFTAVPLFAIGTGALFPLITLELSASGYGYTVIGSMTSAWYLGAFLGTIFGGSIIARVGYRRAFTATTFLAAFSVWGLTVTELPALWIFLRFWGGIGLGTYYLLMESWVSGLATPNTRGRMIAIYESVRIGAVALGPILLIFASAHTAFALIGALFIMAAVPMASAKPPVGSFKGNNLRQAIDVFVCSPCSIALTFVAGLLSSSFYGLGAIYAEGMAFSSAEIAVFMSVILLVPAISQFPVGTLADLYGRAGTSVFTSSLALICAVILALQLPGSFLAILIVAAIVTGFSHPQYALAHGRLVDGGHDLITATTAGLIGYNVGTFLGPLGAATAMDLGGPSGLYTWVSACLAGGIFSAVLAMLQPRTRCCAL